MTTEILCAAANIAREEADEAVRKWRSHMRDREMGHDLYYTDPYGQAADLRTLARLCERQSAAEDAVRMEG